MVWREGNLPTGHRTTVRTGLPTVAWRLINSGVTPSKSTTAQIDEQAGILEAWSEVDVDLVTLNGNEASLRLSEARAFIEAMNQEMAQTLFYGNMGLAPEEFTGLSVRYSSLSAGNATNILDAGGSDSADSTSIWLVAWDEETLSGIFPKGSKAGLQHNDYGEVTVEVTAGVAGQRMRALQERWQWKAGIALKDWRFVVRIANVDVSNLAGGTAADLVDLMENALEILPNEMGRPVFYMNRTVARYLRKQERADVTSGGGLTFENVGGRRITSFSGVPVRRVDALLNTEARVV
jgi:major capsid protein gp7